jgi:hypothetical protein
VIRHKNVLFDLKCDDYHKSNRFCTKREEQSKIIPLNKIKPLKLSKHNLKMYSSIFSSSFLGSYDLVLFGGTGQEREKKLQEFISVTFMI